MLILAIFLGIVLAAAFLSDPEGFTDELGELFKFLLGIAVIGIVIGIMCNVEDNRSYKST